MSRLLCPPREGWSFPQSSPPGQPQGQPLRLPRRPAASPFALPPSLLSGCLPPIQSPPAWQSSLSCEGVTPVMYVTDTCRARPGARPCAEVAARPHPVGRPAGAQAGPRTVKQDGKHQLAWAARPPRGQWVPAAHCGPTVILLGLRYSFDLPGSHREKGKKTRCPGTHLTFCGFP